MQRSIYQSKMSTQRLVIRFLNPASAAWIFPQP
jgi:hypothetical protein